MNRRDFLKSIPVVGTLLHLPVSSFDPTLDPSRLEIKQPHALPEPPQFETAVVSGYAGSFAISHEGPPVTGGYVGAYAFYEDGDYPEDVDAEEVFGVSLLGWKAIEEDGDVGKIFYPLPNGEKFVLGETTLDDFCDNNDVWYDKMAEEIVARGEEPWWRKDKAER